MIVKHIISERFEKFLEIRRNFITFLSGYDSNTGVSLIPSDWVNYSNRDANTRLAFDVFQLSKTLLSPSRICDLGANPPILTYMLQSLGHKVTSVDYSAKDWFHESIKRHLGLVVWDIESKGLRNLLTNQLESGFYDAVTLTETFEHLRIDPIQLMLEIRSILKDDGLLYITTPNLRRLGSLKSILFDKPLLSRSLHLTYSHLRLRGFCGHYREFSLNEMDDFLVKMGFEKVYAGSYDLTLLEANYFPSKDKPYFNKTYISSILMNIKDAIFFRLGVSEQLYLLYRKKKIGTVSYQFGEEAYE